MTTTDDLIARAAGLIRVHETAQGALVGDVGAALLSRKGSDFTGVCVGTPTWGLCAEASAAAAMITAGEYEIAKIVAVWRNQDTGALFVLPPCGHCRAFLRDISSKNLSAEVILGRERAVPLSALLPEHSWPAPLAARSGP